MRSEKFSFVLGVAAQGQRRTWARSGQTQDERPENGEGHRSGPWLNILPSAPTKASAPQVHDEDA
jgi:hypothetical protein